MCRSEYIGSRFLTIFALKSWSPVGEANTWQVTRARIEPRFLLTSLISYLRLCALIGGRFVLSASRAKTFIGRRST